MNGTNNTAVLLMHCPDKPGILAVVTEFINQHKGNILYLDQYVNREEKVFFMRVEWDLNAFEIPKEKIEDYFYDKEFRKEVYKKVADYIENNLDKFTTME